LKVLEFNSAGLLGISGTLTNTQAYKLADWLAKKGWANLESHLNGYGVAMINSRGQVIACTDRHAYQQTGCVCCYDWW
jgi:predicted AlkP superfamily phosphohydrolase/phosphomutase